MAGNKNEVNIDAALLEKNNSCCGCAASIGVCKSLCLGPGLHASPGLKYITWYTRILNEIAPEVSDGCPLRFLEYP